MNVVLLHGWGTGAAVMTPLAACLASSHRACALPLAGYDGAAAPAHYTLDALAVELARQAPARCCAIGWSLGAQLALQWARAQPEQVTQLVLIAATPCFVARGDWPHAMQETVFDAFAASLAADCARTLTRFAALQAFGDVAAEDVRRALKTVSAAHNMDSRVLDRGLAILRDSDLRPWLSGLEQRALVVHGQRDALVPLAAAEWLARALPNAKLEVISGAGHAPFISQPEATCRAVMDFLDG